jgi:hypothetical protein
MIIAPVQCLPKKPVWDQARLAEIAQRISTSGDNPAEFLDISYKVAERKYTAQFLCLAACASHWFSGRTSRR